MTRRDENPTFSFLEVRTSGHRDGAEDLVFGTSEGENIARHHEAPAGHPAVLWVFGSGGGLGGPAGGLYERLGRRLAPGRAASLQLDYRDPGNMVACVLDVLVGVEYLKSRGHVRVVLVGHSFGGAVVINAALSSDDVIAVASLSSQTYGVGNVAELSPRPIFLVHGEADEVLPYLCSAGLFVSARKPKELKLYPGCRHGLDACRDELDADLEGWLDRVT